MYFLMSPKGKRCLIDEAEEFMVGWFVIIPHGSGSTKSSSPRDLPSSSQRLPFHAPAKF